MQPGDFSDLEALETLYLNGNALSELPAGVFSDLEALETLYLNGNALSELPAGVFTGLAALQDLGLNGNALVSLPTGVFSDLAALQDLGLNHNKLSSLPAGVFTGLEALQDLYLNNNELVSLPARGFTDLEALDRLYLYYNKLSSLPDEVFTGLTSLTYLTMHHNELVSLRADVFSGLTALQDLYLYDNDLTTLPDGVFSDLTALETLRLNDNALTSLPAGVFSDLTALETLRLNDNALESLPAGVFSDLTALELLDLHNNALTSLPAGVFSGLTALFFLSLGDNPNTGHLLQLSVTLEHVESNQVRAKVLAGAPLTVNIPVTVANGTLAGDVTALTVEAGKVEGTAVTVSATPGTTEPVTVEINLSIQPSLRGVYGNLDHRGYIFVVDLPANTTTSGVVEVGGSGARSTIYKPIFVESTGDNDVDGYEFDTDWFAVELEAGRTYRIDMKGKTPTNGFTLRLPQINAIYDADGESLVNTFFRDESSAHHLFRVTFHARADGTYYIAASGESFEWGYYELTVKDVTAGPASKPAVASEPPGLAPNVPNPFNPSTVIPYRLDTDGPVRLEIYNLLGQRIRTLVDEVQAAGAYRVRWEARDGRGAAVATGVYFIRLQHPGGVQTRRMLYLK